jgi:hypothetical protein
MPRGLLGQYISKVAHGERPDLISVTARFEKPDKFGDIHLTIGNLDSLNSPIFPFRDLIN